MLFRKLEYTRETLLKFKEEFEAKQLAAVTGQEKDGFGGFGAGAGEKVHMLPFQPIYDNNDNDNNNNLYLKMVSQSNDKDLP